MNSKFFVLGLILMISITITIGKGASNEQITNLKALETSLPSSRIKTKTTTSLFNNNFANLTGHAWEVREVVFSPNGQILASGSSDGSIRLWDVTTGEVIRILQRHHYDVVALDFSPDGSILASGGWDKKINLWDVSSGDLLQTWTVAPQVVLDLAFSPDGKSIAVGTGDWGGHWYSQINSTLRIIDVTSGELLYNFTGHTNSISSVEFSPDGLTLASGSWDNSIKLWNVTTGTEILSFLNHSHIVTSIAFSSEGATLASSSFDKTIKLWDTRSGTLLQNFNESNQEIWSVALSGDDSILAAAVGHSDYWPRPMRYWEFFGAMTNSTIVLYDLISGKLVDTLEGHDHIINSIDFSPDGTMLASASWDWTVKLWGDHSPLTVEISPDEWPTSSPEEEGVNSTILNQISEDNSRIGLHSFLVVRHGKLIFEQYYSDFNHIYNKNSKHVLFSATKSFTSSLIGIAINKGFIESTSQKVLDFFPDYTFSNVDSRKEAMTLENLLTMTSGIDWYEGDPTDDLGKMAYSLDSVQFVLDRPMVTDPGSYFRYNSGCSHLLSAIIQQTTGNTTREFALKYLFEPLGIKDNDVIWMADTQGNAFGGIGLYLTPRNMAKFGQLYLNKGTWNGERIISSSWITTSTKDYIADIPVFEGFGPYEPVTGYGYQWWISSELNSYSAVGYDGKMIIVIPKEDLIVVFTARTSPRSLYPIVSDILEALIPSDRPITWSFVLLLPAFMVLILIRNRKRKK